MVTDLEKCCMVTVDPATSQPSEETSKAFPWKKKPGVDNCWETSFGTYRHYFV